MGHLTCDRFTAGPCKLLGASYLLGDDKICKQLFFFFWLGKVQIRCAVLFIAKGCESTLPDSTLEIVPTVSCVCCCCWGLLLRPILGGWAGSPLVQSDNRS